MILAFLLALLAGAALCGTPVLVVLRLARRPFALGFQPCPSADPRFLIGGQC